MRDYTISELRKVEEAYLDVVGRNMPTDESEGAVSLNDSMWLDWREGNDGGYPCEDAFVVMSEFFEDKRSGRNRRRFDLIPAEQYLNALRKFMKEGPELFDFPDRILDDWLHIVFSNASYIDTLTQIAGHSTYLPSGELEDFFADFEDTGVSDWSDYEAVTEYLDRIGFYEWCVLPDGSDPWSDYALKPLYAIMQSVSVDASPSDKIVALNRCLDVVHCRGDLSSAFIEGGRSTLSRISNDRA